MRGFSVAAWGLLLLAMAGPTPSEAIWGDLLPAITSQLTSLWQNNELEFMGSTCYYTQRPRFYRWELYFHGSFTCPTWTRIRGRAQTRSRSGVMGKTIEDFLNKARTANIVTEDEARIWLEGYED